MKKLKIADIKACPWNPRGEIAPESVKELAESVANLGLINPLTLWKSPDGEVYCIAGNRRLAALRSIGAELDEGDYTLLDGEDENQARMLTLTENLQREDIGIIDEADGVRACIERGMTPEDISAKTGRSMAWVRRRVKVARLSSEWAEFARNNPGKITGDALEKIAVFPEGVQDAAWHTTRHYADGDDAVRWVDVAWAFSRESRDIDRSAVVVCDGVCSKCRKCENRTGVEADLFGLADGELGKCLDGKCFKKQEAKAQKEVVKRLCGDAESVVVDSRWELPHDGAEERSAENPCAYVFFNGAEAIVKWGQPQVDEDEKEEQAEDPEKAARDAENRARRERISEITSRLGDCFNCLREDKSAIEAKVDAMIRKHTKAELAYIREAVVERMTEYRSGHEWADFLRLFGWAAEMSGVSADDAAFLMGEFPERGDGDDEEA